MAKFIGGPCDGLTVHDKHRDHNQIYIRVRGPDDDLQYAVYQTNDEGDFQYMNTFPTNKRFDETTET